MGRARGAVVVVVLLLLTGCTTITGQAEPAAPPAPTPTRPREIRIDGVDPCSLLTETQRAELGLDGRPVFDNSPSALYSGGDAPACVTRGSDPRAVSAGITVVATTGIELYTSRRLDVDIQPADVRGFPSVLAIPRNFTEWCSVIVDVAPGQLLDVQFADGGRVPPIPQADLCQDAIIVADRAMDTLLRTR